MLPECDSDISASNLIFFENFKEYSIDYCINCAAYTAVDKAEDEVELSNKLNHLAVKNFAEIIGKNRT